MKIVTVFLALAVLFTVTSCGDDFDAEAEKEKLEAVSVAYYDAFVNQEIERLNSLDDDDWEGFYGNFHWQGTASGDNEYDPGAIGTEITVHSREWMIAPELAVAKSRETWDWGDGSTHHYLLTMVWEKTDGEWLLTHNHMSEYTP